MTALLLKVRAHQFPREKKRGHSPIPRGHFPLSPSASHRHLHFFFVGQSINAQRWRREKFLPQLWQMIITSLWPSWLHLSRPSLLFVTIHLSGQLQLGLINLKQAIHSKGTSSNLKQSGKYTACVIIFIHTMCANLFLVCKFFFFPPLRLILIAIGLIWKAF